MPKVGGAKIIDNVLEMIESSIDGILQSDLRKLLDIDSKRCSQVIGKLEEMGLIQRERTTKDGVRTFRIRAVYKSSCYISMEEQAFLERYIDTYLPEIYMLYLTKRAQVISPSS